MTAARQIFRRVMIALFLVVALDHFFANWPLATEVTQQKRGDFSESIQPMLERFCYDCHGRKNTEGEVNLTEFTTWAGLENNPRLIERMVEALAKNEMPPEENRQPTDDQRKTMLRELHKAFQNSVARNRSASWRRECWRPRR